MSEKDKKEYEEYHTVYNNFYWWAYQHQLVGWKQIAVENNLNLLPIQLENLHDKPKKTVKEIARFIGIKFNKGLMKSTFCGLVYWGDKRAVKKISGFSSTHTRISSYEKCFTKYDVMVINQLSALKHKEYKYLLQDNEYMRILVHMIQTPTKIEKDALDYSTSYTDYQKAMVAYKRRVKFCLDYLKSPEKEWELVNWQN